MKKTIIIYSILLSLTLSCNSNSSELVSTEKVVTEEFIQNVIEDLKKSNTIDKEKVSLLIKSIDSFSEKNPKNINTPKHLELKAKYLGAMGQNKEALEVYNNIYSNYLSYANRPDALFMMAFLSENNMGDKEKAKAYYQKYIDEFPKGEFLKDAKFSIENIDKTPEELMEMFNNKNKTTSK